MGKQIEFVRPEVLRESYEQNCWSWQRPGTRTYREIEKKNEFTAKLHACIICAYAQVQTLPVQSDIPFREKSLNDVGGENNDNQTPAKG